MTSDRDISTTRRAKAPRPVVLCVMDGWGHRVEAENNAVALAQTPVFDRLVKTCPGAFLATCGRDVGLPDGQMGNSEVGHMNLGAGRVVMQDLPRIDAAIEDGSLATNARLVAFADALKRSGGRCHLVGLVSPGGVHSHQRHVAALARAVAGMGVEVLVHALTDGRDTPPKSAAADLRRFHDELAGSATVATVVGRFHAMDRDKRWERVEAAWRAMVLADGAAAPDPVSAVEAAYAQGDTDEFVTPTAIGGFTGMVDGDGLLMANFRADRAREILAALLDPAFDGFDRPRRPTFAAAAGMVEYSDALNRWLSTLFPPEFPDRTLGEVVADAGLRQLRLAETEKYPHVTFFLNGGRETELPGEERILVPSPKVRTYDLRPEMSAPEVRAHLVDAIRSESFDLIVVNFANPDMVGHTGVLAAAIKAVETVDACVGQVEEALRAVGGVMFLTADHGNCETMVDPETGGPHTAHTLNRVRALLVNAPAAGSNLAGGLSDGRLADVAPTLLALMGLDQPAEMTGTSLLRSGAADDGGTTARATA